jgi:hypothetical protein
MSRRWFARRRPVTEPPLDGTLLSYSFCDIVQEDFL